MTNLFDLYKIGVGPSSSHTMGPMRAACRFARELDERGKLVGVDRVRVELYGSLALTGLGHGTDRAVLLGLAGNEPATIDPASIESTVAEIRGVKKLNLGGKRKIDFDEDRDLPFRRESMFPPEAKTQHPNGLRLTAFDVNGNVIDERTFFSIGGGFIVEDGREAARADSAELALPYPFRNAAELLDTARAQGLKIHEVMMANECARLRAADPGASDAEIEARVRTGIETIWQTMKGCIERGISTEGILPGGLKVVRRAPRFAERLRATGESDPLAPLDWVKVYAMAVNEENAAGGRVVTAPTNGAAGVVPAVAAYYERFVQGSDQEGIIRFFLTSAAIGILYKENASISGAEVGCQGEVGVACSMAAGGLIAAMDGTNGQVEHAAEIAMEHNLGMTCDPIGGLVQIPCIERNAMGAVKAVHASRFAMSEAEEHKVSLDQVIKTMYQTGLDMQSRYKETSLAGLALNVIEC
jgi:L-serine dehydratase